MPVNCRGRRADERTGRGRIPARAARRAEHVKNVMVTAGTTRNRRAESLLAEGASPPVAQQTYNWSYSL